MQEQEQQQGQEGMVTRRRQQLREQQQQPLQWGEEEDPLQHSMQTEQWHVQQEGMQPRSHWVT